MRDRFDVFDDPVELLLTGERSNGVTVVLTQTCKPGGGPPPHRHVHEDELFQTISGEFELFDGDAGVWNPLPAGAVVFAPKGGVHTFRNCGSTVGKIQIVAIGGPVDKFLRGLSRFRMPGDMQAMVDYSAKYGITYPTLPAPTTVEEPTLSAQ